MAIILSTDLLGRGKKAKSTMTSEIKFTPTGSGYTRAKPTQLRARLWSLDGKFILSYRILSVGKCLIGKLGSR
ncbi:hypothetical protein J6590_004438 [Homalodisca vitripennis]|nr:hypothetical protein J6590_004438 [Homalodisca vitripennis]